MTVETSPLHRASARNVRSSQRIYGKKRDALSVRGVVGRPHLPHDRGRRWRGPWGQAGLVGRSVDILAQLPTLVKALTGKGVTELLGNLSESAGKGLAGGAMGARSREDTKGR